MRTTRYTDGKSKEEILAEAKDLILSVDALSKNNPTTGVYYGSKTVRMIDLLDHLKNLTPTGIAVINGWHAGNLIADTISRSETELKKFEKRWEPKMFILVYIAIAGFLFLVGAGIKVLFFS